MISTKSRVLQQDTEATPSRCRVCKKDTLKIRTRERKTTRVLLIPVFRTEEFFEICTECRARMRVKPGDQLIDSTL